MEALIRLFDRTLLGSIEATLLVCLLLLLLKHFREKACSFLAVYTLDITYRKANFAMASRKAGK
jgi:hypothetical protein